LRATVKLIESNAAAILAPRMTRRMAATFQQVGPSWAKKEGEGADGETSAAEKRGMRHSIQVGWKKKKASRSEAF